MVDKSDLFRSCGLIHLIVKYISHVISSNIQSVNANAFGLYTGAANAARCNEVADLLSEVLVIKEKSISIGGCRSSFTCNAAYYIV